MSTDQARVSEKLLEGAGYAQKSSLIFVSYIARLEDEDCIPLNVPWT